MVVPRNWPVVNSTGLSKRISRSQSPLPSAFHHSILMASNDWVLRDSVSDHHNYMRLLVEMDEKDKRVPTIPRIQTRSTFPAPHPVEVLASFTSPPPELEFAEAEGRTDEENNFLERCAIGLSVYEPERIPLNISGAYVMYDENRNKIGVFKPFDEQIDLGLVEGSEAYDSISVAAAPKSIVVMCRHRVFDFKEKFGVLEEFSMKNLPNFKGAAASSSKSKSAGAHPGVRSTVQVKS